LRCDHHGAQIQSPFEALSADVIRTGCDGGDEFIDGVEVRAGSGKRGSTLRQNGGAGGGATPDGGAGGSHGTGHRALTRSIKHWRSSCRPWRRCSHNWWQLEMLRRREGLRVPSVGAQEIWRFHPTVLAPGRNRVEDEVKFNCAALPKLGFPKFCGDHPRIWIDKCCDYFHIYNIPECMWTTAASLHMEDNAAKWLQVYKLKVGLGDWGMFVAAVEEKFGAYDYRKVVQDLLALRQEGNLEDYIREFEAIQFQVSMFNTGFDELFFTSHFVNGLKDEIRGVVQAQLPDSVDRVTLLAQNQQQIVDRSKFR
jgi:hypothetical protein